MSTLRQASRLLNLNVLVPLGLGLGLASGLAGCSTTPGTRTGSMSKMKTYLSVGDKPLPVVSGEPGSTLAADTGSDLDANAPTLRRRARSDGRISGRVYDSDGRPVADARVRLAVSGAKGGKVVNALTDRSGGFTLHGLRPGSEYTLIAESDGEGGLMTGRAEARTSDVDVRISLGAQENPPDRASAPAHVNRVSDREPADDSEPGGVFPAGSDGLDNQSQPASPVNEDDLPPALEAEAMTGAGSTSTSTSTESRPPVSIRHSSTGATAPVTWKRIGQTGGGASQPEAAPVDPEARGTAAPVEEATPYDDDGENPLPPALERVPEQSASADLEPPAPPPRTVAFDPEPEPDAEGKRSPEAHPTPVAKPPSTQTREPGREWPSRRASATRPPAASSPFESPTSPTEPVVSTPPEAVETPGALVVVPETFGPVVVHEPDPFHGQHPAAVDPSPAPEPEPEPAPEPKPAPAPAPERSNRRSNSGPSASARPVETRPAATVAGEKRRPTWGEITASATMRAGTENERSPEAPGRGRDELAKADVAQRTVAMTGQGAPSRPIKTAYGKPECEYDERLRRIIDFRLPDLDGKTVRFQDLDADLVLIDFWGTWCQPCLRSIPHLVELQERMGKRMKVIGVACEAEVPETASAKVAETVKRLSVNYQVLLSRNDGSCPLQEALHVQAFPTMILVDREGRVIWRDQGATTATLARLDRILAVTPKRDETRKY